MKPARVRVEISRGGAACALVLDGPPGNVIGFETAEALARAVAERQADPRTRLLVVTGEGAHFSAGASVQEHLPPVAHRMLASMCEAVLVLLRCEVPTLAAVRGRALGGGLEIALACGWIWAEEGATFATPEIRLGVFAPFASALLTDAVPRGIAEELLLTGREISGREALAAGLASRLVAQGTLDAEIGRFLDETLAPLSGRALRLATRASRARRAARLKPRLCELERLYAGELLRGREGDPEDEATEGLRAFLEKRAPRWSGP